ncbi:MAG: hypothetical protein QXJ27_05350 [Thermoplasmata archaeon]
MEREPMEKRAGRPRTPSHILRFGTKGIIYNGEIYSFPSQKMREEVLKQIRKVEKGRSLYAEMDLKARLYKYSKGKFET